MRRILALLALTVLTAFAADVTGAWKGTMDAPMGAMDITANLKADGNAVTGALNFMDNYHNIEHGKLDGDKISFELNLEFGTIAYKGSVSGDEMKLTVTVGDNEVPLVLKRVKE
jgi:hypothetical protein